MGNAVCLPMETQHSCSLSHMNTFYVFLSQIYLNMKCHCNIKAWRKMLEFLKNTQTHTHQREMLWSSYSDLCCLGDDSAVLLHRVGLPGGGPAEKTRVFEEGRERSLVLPVRLPPVLPSFPRSLYFLLLHCCLLHGCALWVHCRGGGAEAANVAVRAPHDASRQNAPRWRGRKGG